MTPPITVLMSVYNGERWLHESIDSVLRQTHSDFEFIIVNDGSKDTSLDIIDDFASKDRRIRIIDKPNTGLADSLNVGIQQARGEWIARIDADDICDLSRLQKQFNLASADPGIVLIGSGLVEIDESGRIGKEYLLPTEHNELFIRLMMVRPFFSHSSAFYKTAVARLVGGYRVRIKRGQDLDLWLRLSEKGKLACICEPLIKYRKHADQVTHEEGGRRQIIDSRVAMTSYWLRRIGRTDPVDTANSDKEFDRFREWVAQQLNSNNFFSYHDYIRNLKQEGRTNNKSFFGRLRVVVFAFAKPSFIFRYVREKTFGECIAKRMANQWIKLDNSSGQ